MQLSLFNKLTYILPTHNFHNLSVVKELVTHTRLIYCRVICNVYIQFHSLCFYVIRFSLYDPLTFLPPQRLISGIEIL
jgi:hypothetical protein